MEPTDITLDILRKIHEGMGGLREDVRGNSRRLESLEGKVDAQGRRLGAIEGRLHELVEVTTLCVTRQLDLVLRVDAIEGRVTALEAR